MHGFQQHTIWVAMHDALDRTMRMVADRVFTFLGQQGEFGRIRDELSSYGIDWIG
jgi:hypothetical protein